MSVQLPNSGLFGQFETNEQDWGDRANANWFILDQMAAPAIEVGITSTNDPAIVQTPGAVHLYLAEDAAHGQIWIFTNTSTSGGATTSAFIRIDPMPGRMIYFKGVPLIWDRPDGAAGRWRPASQFGTQVIELGGSYVVDCERINGVFLDLQGDVSLEFEKYRRGQRLDIGMRLNGHTLTSSNLSSATAGAVFSDQLLRAMFTDDASENPAEPFLILG